MIFINSYRIIYNMLSEHRDIVGVCVCVWVEINIDDRAWFWHKIYNFLNNHNFIYLLIWTILVLIFTHIYCLRHSIHSHGFFSRFLRVINECMCSAHVIV